jgi:hypothetical protein
MDGLDDRIRQSISLTIIYAGHLNKIIGITGELESEIPRINPSQRVSILGELHDTGDPRYGP